MIAKTLILHGVVNPSRSWSAQLRALRGSVRGRRAWRMGSLWRAGKAPSCPEWPSAGGGWRKGELTTKRRAAMSLTFSAGPLSGHPPETVNYRIEGPAHKLLMHEFPRRVRAVFGGQTVVDTTRAVLLHETGLPPQVYVPVQDIRADLIQPTEHHTYCPFKGTASYWTVTAARQGQQSQVAENAIWSYPEPNPEASWLKGYAGFYWGAMDEWYDEDERVEGHLPDPYHRVDVRRSSRHVRGRLTAT